MHLCWFMLALLKARFFLSLTLCVSNFLWVAQVGTGFSSHMSFRQRVENVLTYATVGLIDWVAFHRCFLYDVALLPPGSEPSILQEFLRCLHAELCLALQCFTQ